MLVEPDGGMQTSTVAEITGTLSAFSGIFNLENSSPEFTYPVSVYLITSVWMSAVPVECLTAIL
jgi:hypothetical protein